MLIAEAHVQTDDPRRYLVQLCRHARQAHRLPHRRRTHDRDDAHAPPEVQRVEWSETRGIVTFGWGRCTIQASPGDLTLLAEADSEENLRQIQDIVAADIERFGRRDHLAVHWQRPRSPAARPGQASGRGG